MLEALAKDALINLRASCQAARQSSLPSLAQAGAVTSPGSPPAGWQVWGWES